MARRVAFLDHTAVLGGAEISLAAMASGLDRRRWEPFVVLGSDGPLLARLAADAVHAEVFQFPESSLQPGSPSFVRMLSPRDGAAGSRFVSRLARRLRQQGAAIVHCNSLRACVIGGLAARQARIPSVWHVHSIVSSEVLTPTSARLIKTLARILPRRVICNSSATAAALGLPGRRVSVIPSGVDPAPFTSLNELFASGRAPRVGMIARIAPLKGQDVFVQAAQQIASRYPEVEFVIAGAPLFGEESYERSLHRHADAFRARIAFKGFVTDVPRQLGELDVVVHASVKPEGFGLSVVEAMLAGRPVVATNLGGTAEIVEDAVTGYLVPPRDPRAIAEAVISLLDDPTAAREMGSRARRHAAERFGLSGAIQAIESVYEEVLAA